MNRSVVAVGDDPELVEHWAALPYRIYADEPNWPPPIRAEVVESLDRTRNPLFRHADIEHFVLMEDDEPIGRVAATIHHAYNTRFGGRTGFFGFLDFPEGDVDASRRLLDAAEQWLRGRGMTRSLGPYNYYSGQEMGTLVSGFEDYPPAAFQTFSRPTDGKVIEACGYRTAFSLGVYRLTASEMSDKFAAIRESGARARQKFGLTSRTATAETLAADLEQVRWMFNESFRHNKENVEYPADVFDHLVGPMMPMLDPVLIRFLERDGEPVGFVWMMPDVNEVLRKVGGDLDAHSAEQVAQWVSEIRSAVLLITGVLPGAPFGVGNALIDEITSGALEGGYEELHTTWVHEGNRAMSRLIQGYSGRTPARYYAMFDHDLRSS